MDRRSNSAGKLRFGAFEADLRSGELRKDGVAVKIQEQPFQILALLLRHSGEVVTREELRKVLWPDGIHVDFENGLNIAVKKLRQALDDDADVPKYVETLPRRGYRFIVSVTALNEKQESDAAVAGTENPALPVALSGLSVPRWLGAALVLATLVIATALALRSGYFGAGKSGSIRSIAVLPLQNLSGDPSQEYFADGMTEELITDLAQVRALRVISRTSSMLYKGTHKSAPAIGRELNVDAVVEGAVVHSGGRVRITAQLIEAGDDRHLWASSYEQDLRDVLSVQDTVARAIADQIRLELTPREERRLNSPRPVNPRAYEAYLKARYAMNTLTQDGLEKGLALLRRAIAIDPKYAPSYAAISDYYLAEADWRLSPRDSFPKAKDAAQTAVSLDPSLANAHADLALVRFWYEWDWPAAEGEFKTALALNASDASAHSSYATALAWMGKADESISEAQRAIALDPVSIDTARMLGEDYYFSHRFEDAIRQLRKTVAMDPSYWFPHMSLGRSYLQAGRTQEAVAELETACRLSPDLPDPWAALGNAYATAGRKELANDVLARLKLVAQRDYHVAPYYFAIIHAGLGDTSRALDYLEQDYGERSLFMTWLKTDPVLNGLRSNPRFQDLMRRTRLP